jgi:hypothetical protein
MTRRTIRVSQLCIKLSRTHAANIAVLGHYVSANFVASDDGSGHLMITDPPLHQKLA